MKVLFIGDIMGEPGRRAIARTLHKVVAQHAVDLVIGNGENVAGGFGITPELEIFDDGMLATADALFAKGLLQPPAHFDFVLGVPGAAAATASSTGSSILPL